MPRPAIERFEEKYEPVPESGCWLWTGAALGGGYGCFTPDSQNPSYLAHRWAYEHFVGPIPPGAHVMHTCDVRGCVNPAHLRLGSHRDNMRDMTIKRRQAQGERNAAAKLTTHDVRCIRDSGDGAKTLATRYGVAPSTISMIRTRTTWRHVE